jgi:hypothetical protein
MSGAAGATARRSVWHDSAAEVPTRSGKSRGQAPPSIVNVTERTSVTQVALAVPHDSLRPAAARGARLSITPIFRLLLNACERCSDAAHGFEDARCRPEIESEERGGLLIVVSPTLSLIDQRSVTADFSHSGRR